LLKEMSQILRIDNRYRDFRSMSGCVGCDNTFDHLTRRVDSQGAAKDGDQD
jgi:hypothetical protein